MLPDYLKYKADGTCEDSQVVLCGDCRFTVLTNKLLRIEQGEFCDRATLSVINRKLDKAAFCVSELNGVLTLQTEDLRLEYKVGTRISAETLSVTLLGNTAETCNFGQKPLHNLGGTVTTLDEVNGAIPSDDGVCSLDGFAWVDDSKTPCFDDNGWFIPRTEGIIDSYCFGYGHHYADCVKDYYRLTGVP
ncbi:MAG: DUF4968 domain-containing protein, partial [Clostridia bacterium]|nr:DUF4968 domain-containing protein [Clostridia bacterium]